MCCLWRLLLTLHAAGGRACGHTHCPCLHVLQEATKHGSIVTPNPQPWERCRGAGRASRALSYLQLWVYLAIVLQKMPSYVGEQHGSCFLPIPQLGLMASLFPQLLVGTQDLCVLCPFLKTFKSYQQFSRGSGRQTQMQADNEVTEISFINGTGQKKKRMVEICSFTG